MDNHLVHCTVVCLHTSMLYAVCPATPCVPHASTSHPHAHAPASVSMSGHALAYTLCTLCPCTTPYPCDPPLREEWSHVVLELFTHVVSKNIELLICEMYMCITHVCNDLISACLRNTFVCKIVFV